MNGTTAFEPQSAADAAFAQELIAYWLAFVRAGDPSAGRLVASPPWPAYRAAARYRIALQEPTANTTASGSRVETEDAAESVRCEFVASLARSHQA